MRLGEPVAPGVGDLDAEGAGDHVEREPEVPSRDAAVGRRVDGQLGDDLAGRIHGQAPGTQLGCPEAPGLVGAAWRGGELHAEVADGGGRFGGSLIHVTQRGRSCVPWNVTLCVRTVTVRWLSGAVGAVPTVGTGRAPRASRTVPRERCGMTAVEAGAGRLKEEADEPGWEVDPDDEWGVAVITTVGRQLKLRREAAGLRAAEFGRIVGYGEDMVYKIEGGKRIPRQEFLDKADEVLNAGGLIAAAWEDVKKVRYPKKVRALGKLEAAAVEIAVYQSNSINGLLQTPEHARAVIGAAQPPYSPDDVERMVAARIARRTVFERDPAPALSFVLEEGVMRRPIGGTMVWRQQLERLLEVGRLHNVVLQVMPTNCETHSGTDGTIELLKFADGTAVGRADGEFNGRPTTDPKQLRILELQYGTIRAQALSPRESLAFIEHLLGET